MVASNPAGVFSLVQRFACHEADAYRDGDYCFSVRLGKSGTWSIFQREAEHALPSKIEDYPARA